MFEIERDVPSRSGTYRGRYPFQDLRQAGDSFLMRCRSWDRHNVQISLHASCRAYNQRWAGDDPIKIETWSEPEGIRVRRAN